MAKTTFKPALWHYERDDKNKDIDHTHQALDSDHTRETHPFNSKNLISSAGVTVSSNGLNLEGTSGADLIVATVNQKQLFGFAGDDRIFGSPQDDRIDGGTGADIMVGGKGNDTYLVDDPCDLVVERAGEGIDTVGTTIGYTLPDNVENMYVAGSSILGGTLLVGNALDNHIVGAPFSYETILGLGGNDRLEGGGRIGGLLDGGSGDDILILSIGELIGGSGADTFVAAGRGAMTSPDVPITITDFNAAEGDKIVIYASQDYSSADLFTRGVLKFDAAASKLILDFDPATNAEASVNQIICLTGVHTFDPAWVSVTDHLV